MKTNLLQNLSKQRYLEYLKMLPDLRKQKTRDYTMLVLTFFAMTFFGIFAINPTLSTITKLLRELKDSKFTEKSLEEKISNLSSLIQKQNELSSDLPFVLAAVPETAHAPELLGQIQSIAASTGVTIIDLQSYEVSLTPNRQTPKTNTYEFSVNVEGDESTLTQFLTKLTKFNRLLVITNVSYSTSGKKSLNIKGIVFFIPKP